MKRFLNIGIGVSSLVVVLYFILISMLFRGDPLVLLVLLDAGGLTLVIPLLFVAAKIIFTVVDVYVSLEPHEQAEARKYGKRAFVLFKEHLKKNEKHRGKVEVFDKMMED